MTETDYIRKLEAVYAEIEVLNDDIKEIKAEAKGQGFKPAKLGKIAKLRAQAKVTDFIDEVKDIIKTVETNSL